MDFSRLVDGLPGTLGELCAWAEKNPEERTESLDALVRLAKGRDSMRSAARGLRDRPGTAREARAKILKSVRRMKELAVIARGHAAFQATVDVLRGDIIASSREAMASIKAVLSARREAPPPPPARWRKEEEEEEEEEEDRFADVKRSAVEKYRSLKRSLAESGQRQRAAARQRPPPPAVVSAFRGWGNPEEEAPPPESLIEEEEEEEEEEESDGWAPPIGTADEIMSSERDLVKQRLLLTHLFLSAYPSAGDRKFLAQFVTTMEEADIKRLEHAGEVEMSDELQEVHDAIEDFCLKVRNEPDFDLPELAFYFSGPPGTGKTTFMSLAALRLGMVLFAVNIGDMNKKYVGEAEADMRRLFRLLRMNPEPCILFFDESELVLQERILQEESGGKMGKVKAVLLQELNRPGSIVSAFATNMGHLRSLPKKIDGAFEDRFTQQLTVDLPPPEKLAEVVLRRLRSMSADDFHCTPEEHDELVDSLRYRTWRNLRSMLAVASVKTKDCYFIPSPTKHGKYASVERGASVSRDICPDPECAVRSYSAVRGKCSGEVFIDCRRALRRMIDVIRKTPHLDLVCMPRS